MRMLLSELMITAIAAAQTTDSADTTGGAATAAVKAAPSIFTYIGEGGKVTWLLVLISVVALGLIIANAIMLRVSYMAPERVQQDLEKLLRENRLDDAVVYAQQPGNDRFLSAVVARALVKLKRSRFGVLELRSAMEQAGQAEAEKADRITSAIGICAAVGPMLGLFGTVLGLIGAFQSISAKQGAERSAELAMFMSHALIATAAGLVVGIPCTIAYSMFRKRFERVLTDVGEIGERLVSIVEQVSGGGGAPAPARAAVRPLPPVAPIQPPVRQAPTPSVPLAAAGGAGGQGS